MRRTALRCALALTLAVIWFPIVPGCAVGDDVDGPIGAGSGGGAAGQGGSGTGGEGGQIFSTSSAGGSTCDPDEDCGTCGNGELEMGEECDDGNLMPGDGCDAACKTEEPGTCNPDGVYLIQGAPVSYQCCSGLVSVNVSSFIFTSGGVSIVSSPSNPTPMLGSATTCPDGDFINTGAVTGGCTETFTLNGGFDDADTWSGIYSVSFSGQDCDCFGGSLGTPCVSQTYPITAARQ